MPHRARNRAAGAVDPAARNARSMPIGAISPARPRASARTRARRTVSSRMRWRR